MSDFIKLSTLVDNDFTVERVDGYKFKMWDEANKTMLVSDDWQQGYRKVYQVQTDKGTLDLGTGQIGNLLEPVLYQGKADLIGRTFHVKSNGKSGKDIRYYFNPAKEQPKKTEDVSDQDMDEPISLEDVPF
jgi:hypothetical protein